jgi:hypothetical protein
VDWLGRQARWLRIILEASVCTEAASPWSCSWRGDADEGRIGPGEVARVGPGRHTIQFLLGANGDIERWHRLAVSGVLQHADSQVSSIETGSALL